MTYKNTTLNRHKFHLKIIALVFALAAFLPLATPFVHRANAATLTPAYVRLDHLATSTATDNTLVDFTVPAGGATSVDEVDVTFPSSTYISITSPTVTVTGCATDSGATALPGTITATTSAGQIVKVTGVTTLATGTAYCFYINAGLGTTSTPIPTTPAGVGQTTIQTLHTGVVQDSTNVAIATITNDSVAVTASVAPYLTFTLSGNTDRIGSGTTPLSQTAVTASSTPNNITIATNATNGWLAWAKSANGGLHSTSASHTIPTGTVDGTPDSFPGSGILGEHYGLDITKTPGAGQAGTVTVAPEYAGSSTNKFGSLTTATYNLIGSANKPTDGDVLTLTFVASIGALTPAATDYSDTVQFTGAGNF